MTRHEVKERMLGFLGPTVYEMAAMSATCFIHSFVPDQVCNKLTQLAVSERPNQNENDLQK